MTGNLISRTAFSPYPSPIIVPPSGLFDGDDGAWSTFLVNVGDDGSGRFGQNFRALVSTSDSTSLFPLQTDWCDIPSEIICAEHRGILPYNSRPSQGYQLNASSQYQDLGLFNLEMHLPLEGNSTNGRYGLDSIGIGSASSKSPVLVSQLVAGHVSPIPFLSSLGLSTNHLDLGSGGISPYLMNLNASQAIPSLSYSYTAGAKYRENGITGSLILGGYDRNRVGKGISLSMPSLANSSLVVGVQSITIATEPRTGGNVYSATSQSSGFLAVIDSTMPYLWMPKSVCDVFETLFKLTYDSVSGYYLVNDTASAYNRNQNTTVYIQIGDDIKASIRSVSIEFPYEAFDLTGSFPAFQGSTRFFPIRRAIDGMNIIGRAFLQESMLIVDYERRNFTVAQTNFASPTLPAQVVTIAGLHMSVHTSIMKKAPILAIVLPIIIVILILGIAMIVRRFYTGSVQSCSQDIQTTVEGKSTQEMDPRTTISELPSPQSELGDPYTLDGARSQKRTSAIAVELPACSLTIAEKTL